MRRTDAFAPIPTSQDAWISHLSVPDGVEDDDAPVGSRVGLPVGVGAKIEAGFLFGTLDDDGRRGEFFIGVALRRIPKWRLT